MQGPGYNSDGLQQERTDLAWRRTSMSLAVAALLLARLTMTDGIPLVSIFAGASVLVSVWIALVTMRTDRHIRRSEAEPSFDRLAHDGRVVAATCLTMVLLALTEILAVLTGS